MRSQHHFARGRASDATEAGVPALSVISPERLSVIQSGRKPVEDDRREGCDVLSTTSGSSTHF